MPAKDFKVDMKELSKEVDELWLGLDLDGPQADKYRRYGIDVDAQVAEARKRQKK